MTCAHEQTPRASDQNPWQLVCSSRTRPLEAPLSGAGAMPSAGSAMPSAVGAMRRARRRSAERSKVGRSSLLQSAIGLVLLLTILAAGIPKSSRSAGVPSHAFGREVVQQLCPPLPRTGCERSRLDESKSIKASQRDGDHDRPEGPDCAYLATPGRVVVAQCRALGESSAAPEVVTVRRRTGRSHFARGPPHVFNDASTARTMALRAAWLVKDARLEATRLRVAA